MSKALRDRAPRPVRGLERTRAYRVARAAPPTDLRLDSNEGPAPAAAALAAARPRADLRRYPDASGFEELLARRFGVARERVLVTAGADDGILRAALAFLEPGRELIVPTPAFEMIPRYARLAGAELRTVPDAAARYPLEGVLAAIEESGPRLGMVAVVSPSNPTGSAATPGDLERIARATPDALVLVDLAYAEYADEDLTACALELPNAVVLRTMSKAWGLAGARVGWALAAPATVRALRAAGAPYAVSRPSLALACARLSEGEGALAGHVARVRAERERLRELLADLGAAPRASQANFVLCACGDALWLRDALAGLGIAVRAFPGVEGLERCVRITCPGDAADFERLERGLRAALRPEALLFDLDGVLADVSGSYRRAIELTAREFGVEVGPQDIERVKARGDSNCDWSLTRELLRDAGVDASLEDVTACFERSYQGTGAAPGLWREERALCSRADLERLRARMPLAIVTGRPRADALRFLEHEGLEGVFDVLVAREDAALKPDPAPVRLALERLGVRAAWMVGDTPDDLRAARGAGVVPIGVPAPGCTSPEDTAATLTTAGAARVLASVTELEGLLS